MVAWILHPVVNTLFQTSSVVCAKVSLDGKYLLFTQFVGFGSDLMLVEHFR